VGPGDLVVNAPHGEHGLVNDAETELRLLVFEEGRAAGEVSADDGAGA
jgi:hypothetical protein